MVTSKLEAVAGGSRVRFGVDIEAELLRLRIDGRRQCRVFLVSAEIAFNYIKCFLINFAVFVILQELDLVQT